ncbi:MAG: hypothetical protein K1060chlam5_00735 [Candidatus Anoxychlamydiales bacterium]|nr:hypothetical protein [Candidatus Anoxychlamydiales bacterium]
MSVELSRLSFELIQSQLNVARVTVDLETKKRDYAFIINSIDGNLNYWIAHLRIGDIDDLVRGIRYDLIRMKELETEYQRVSKDNLTLSRLSELPEDVRGQFPLDKILALAIKSKVFPSVSNP